MVQLECGHQTHFKASQLPQSRARCRDCGLDALQKREQMEEAFHLSSPITRSLCDE